MAIPAIERDVLLRRIKETVLRFDPGAEVILFGSRARGDARPDSDWDILVLTSDGLAEDTGEAMRNAVYDIEIDEGAVLSTVIEQRSEWESPQRRGSEFRRNIDAEGVAL